MTSRQAVPTIDFGLAKLTSPEPQATALSEAATVEPADQSLTSPGATIGIVAYMSPEQVRGEELDTRTDLFSFGAVLYEMATGRQAFAGSTAGSTFDAILNRAPVAASVANPHVARRLEETINKALEKNRDVRCQSAAELRADLMRLKRDSESAGRRPVKAAGPRPARPRAEATTRERRTAAGRIRALAVLPLANLARDPEQEYFVDGMTEALTAELAQIGALRVISRTSAMHYKGTTKTLPEVASELGVDGIVEGSVLRAGDRVRITAQLIHAATDRHLWGRVHPDKSIEYLRKAIAIEPDYALAHAGVANAYCMLFGAAMQAAPPDQLTPIARAAAHKALAVDEGLGLHRPRRSRARPRVARARVRGTRQLAAARGRHTLL